MDIDKDIRIIEINCCNDCPFFDNEYFGYNETCKKLNQINKNYKDSVLPECPLPKKDI